MQDVQLSAADGTKLHAWFLFPKGWSEAQRRSRPVIMFLQENAGNMSMRLPFLQYLLRYLQCSVLAPRYQSVQQATPPHIFLGASLICRRQSRVPPALASVSGSMYHYEQCTATYPLQLRTTTRNLVLV